MGLVTKEYFTETIANKKRKTILKNDAKLDGMSKL